MYHSVTIGKKNTYTDWHLIATERPVIAEAAPKTRYIDIPGANGSIDLTDALAGRAFLSNREGSFEFYVLNDYSGYEWPKVYKEIADYLHGQVYNMWLEDEPNYMYIGRFSINQWKCQKDWSRIVIDYDLRHEKTWIGTGEEPTSTIETHSGMTKAIERRLSGSSLHSVAFGDVNTYDDLHLVPVEVPVVTMPKPKTKTYDLPGADGQLDLTELLTGEVPYSNREGSFEFYVLNDYPGYSWFDVHNKIVNYLHGKKMRMILEDDPAFYYNGRFAVDSWKTEKDWSRLTISYNLEPFKYYTDDDMYAILDCLYDPILDNNTNKIYSSPFAYEL